jgi:hypothetical protein
MRKICGAALAALLFCGTALADTYVQGYYRKDGTYVQGHWRSDPNSTKSDNYGRPNSRQSNDSYERQTRDQDRDGVSNQYDLDDDNDGTPDDRE